ncbi:Aste57867_19827 [Aphanomyces stellatus]|uniref:Aste57867_19827 protein n=1 Tax=Aphanomyces stellatus TaxID=120398 RepID=A0A485LFD6_9STRA|nr:hypothetical protein As57867_019762 [Aphanomyces stellatus]VFT96525.1 Aste57867_19827 [Aphanomyces stellatus]
MSTPWPWMLSLLLAAAPGNPCSDFLLNSTANVISARTMDFQLDLQTAVELVAVGTPYVEQSGHVWSNRYGFLSFNVHMLPFATDGMNTEGTHPSCSCPPTFKILGLSAAWLYMLGTVYPDPDPSDARPIVSNLCSFIVGTPPSCAPLIVSMAGNYASVAQVKAGLATIQTTGIDLSRIPLTFKAGLGPLRQLPLHLAVHDASGASLVVEFLDGEMHVMDNPVGVLANAPPLGDQLENLKNLHAIPLGMDSTDRFARLALYNGIANQDTFDVETSFTAASVAQGGVARALHLINTVVQPIVSPSFATEWLVVRDHHRRHVFIQSTENSVLRRLDLNALDFSQGATRKTWYIATRSSWYVDADALDDDDITTVPWMRAASDVQFREKIASG